MIKFAIIAESDMFGEDKKKRRKRRQPASEGERIRSFKELSVGDYVVHEGHGVGIYRGIENVEVDGVAKDYIKIEYGGGGSLYILATNLDMIQKYADKDTKQVKVNKMSGPEWTRTKTKVKGAVRELAMDLVKLYAARQEYVRKKKAMSVALTLSGSGSLKKCFRMRRRRISWMP